MRRLEFTGKVHARATPLSISACEEWIPVPDDWPTVARSTWSIQVDDDGYPDGFDSIGNGEGLKRLDEAKLRTVVVIPQRKLTGSHLVPDADHPTRGLVVAWRADLQVLGSRDEASCWVLRIIDSDESQFELLDEEGQRVRLSLAEGTPVRLTLWEAEPGGKLPTPEQRFGEWCEAAERVEDQFGTEKSMGYLIGEKFLNYLEVAETNDEWRQAIPLFVERIKSVFESWQVAVYFTTPHRLGALGHTASEETHQLLRAQLTEEERIREDARYLLLLEWARELLLETDE